MKDAEKGFHYHFTLRDIKHTGLMLTDHFNLHVFELPGVEKMLVQTDNSGFEWLHCLNHAHEEEDDMITKKYTSPLIHKTHNILKTLSADEEVRYLAEMRDQALINERILIAGERKKGKEEGIKIGRKDEAEKVARKMLAGGFKIDEIVKFTELKADEIESLKGEFKNCWFASGSCRQFCK